jgi:hypothetical protein
MKISNTLPSGVKVFQTDSYWLATVDVGHGSLSLEAYPHHDTNTPSAMHWSTYGRYGKLFIAHLERSCEQTWEQWFTWLDEQWPNHELRWAFELLSEAFPD